MENVGREYALFFPFLFGAFETNRPRTPSGVQLASTQDITSTIFRLDPPTGTPCSAFQFDTCRKYLVYSTLIPAQELCSLFLHIPPTSRLFWFGVLVPVVRDSDLLSECCLFSRWVRVSALKPQLNPVLTQDLGISPSVKLRPPYES